MFHPVTFAPSVGREEAAHGLLPFDLCGSWFIPKFNQGLEQSLRDTRRFATVLVRHFAEAEDADPKIGSLGQFLTEDEPSPKRRVSLVVLCAGESDEVSAFRVAVWAFVQAMQPKAKPLVLATQKIARLPKFH